MQYWRAWNKDFQQIVCGAQASDGHWPHGYHYHGDTDIYRTTMTILMPKFITATCPQQRFKGFDWTRNYLSQNQNTRILKKKQV